MKPKKENRYVVYIIPKYLKTSMRQIFKSRGGRADLRAAAIFRTDPPKWFEYQTVEYAIVQPKVCKRLEPLMGTNLVRITDRGYMKMLHDRIQEDYAKQQDDLMALRMDQEIEREKKLVLEGKMKVEEASKELLEHPVFKASQLTKQLIQRRKSVIRKEQLVRCRRYYGPADEEQDEQAVADLDYDTEAEVDARAREKKELLQKVDDISDDYMFKQKDYERLKYESPLVKELKMLQSVEEMYDMAERIVGTFEGAEEEEEKQVSGEEYIEDEEEDQGQAQGDDQQQAT